MSDPALAPSARPDPAVGPPMPKFGRYSVLMPMASGRETGLWWARLRQPLGGFEKDVAIKALHPERCEEPEAVAAFLDEARLSARLTHHNLVQVFEVGAEVGIPYLVMERVSGPTLAALQRRIGRLDRRPDGAIAWIMAQVCRGLAHLHELGGEGIPETGLVHGDVSLDNIIVSPVTGPKLFDLGAAAARLRGKGPLVEKGREADIFQVGICLHWLLTGQPPYPEDSLRTLYDNKVEGPIGPIAQLRPDLAPALASILRRALAKDPAARQPSAHVLAEELDAYCASLPEPPTADAVAALVRELYPPDVAPLGPSLAMEDLERTFTIRTALLLNQRGAPSSGYQTHPLAAFLAGIILVIGLAFAFGYL